MSLDTPRSGRIRQPVAARTSFGWRDIIDLGEITTARGPEIHVAMWVRLWGSLGTGTFNISVVR